MKTEYLYLLTDETLQSKLNTAIDRLNYSRENNIPSWVKFWRKRIEFLFSIDPTLNTEHKL